MATNSPDVVAATSHLEVSRGKIFALIEFGMFFIINLKTPCR
jgi:hypothetical protein